MQEKNNKKIAEKLDNQKFFIAALAVLVVLNLFTIFYFTQIKDGSKNQTEETEDKFQLLNPARKSVNQKDLIINIQPLRDELNKYEGQKDISIYFEYLPTGANISINKDAQFWPASLLKLPVAMAVAKKIEKGEWKWDNKLVLMAADKEESFGTLFKEPTGSIFTIEDLVRRALVDSDNTANFILVRNLETREIYDVYEHLGAGDFFSAGGEIGAKKYSANFRALYNSSYLSEESSQKLLAYLSETRFDEYLKGGLPEGTVYAHKIGVAEDKNVYMDSGIIYAPNRPYILTVMVSGRDKREAEDLMKKISEQVFNYVSGYSEN